MTVSRPGSSAPVPSGLLPAPLAALPAAETPTCGRPTKQGKPCGWPAGECRVHRGLEQRDMGMEDFRSRRVEAPGCGRPTRQGKPCGWPAGECSVHRGLEPRDMGMEDFRSRRVEEGLCASFSSGPRERCDGICEECRDRVLQQCGAPVRSRGGAPCERLAGECPFHAPPGRRCVSALDGDPEATCYNFRADGGEYCIFTSSFLIWGVSSAISSRSAGSLGVPSTLPIS